MMGPAHATTGAAIGLGIGDALVGSGFGPSTPAEVFAFGAVCAGMAIFPDIDHPSSTVARSFGPLSVLLAHGVSAASAAFQTLTGTSKDSGEGGHRGLTHTLLWCIVMGLLATALGAAAGRWGVMIVLFLSLGLAIRGLLADWAKQNGWIGVTIASAAITWLTVTSLGDHGFAWIGLAVAVGNLAHILGDMLTKEGCPLLAPFVPFHGKRWYDVCLLPGPLRLSTNGLVENLVILPVASVAAAAYCLLVFPETRPATIDAISGIGSWFGGLLA